MPVCINLSLTLVAVQECDATGVDEGGSAGRKKNNMLTKTRYFFIAIFIFSITQASGQVMQQKPVWVTIQSPQLKCWVCKDKLEQYLLREKGPSDDAGILKWTINMNGGNIRIQYVPDRMTVDYLRVAINNAGFDADSTKATEEAYKLLPPICRRPEDGGGPQKGKPCNMPPGQ